MTFPCRKKEIYSINKTAGFTNRSEFHSSSLLQSAICCRHVRLLSINCFFPTGPQPLPYVLRASTFRCQPGEPHHPLRAPFHRAAPSSASHFPSSRSSPSGPRPFPTDRSASPRAPGPPAAAVRWVRVRSAAPQSGPTPGRRCPAGVTLRGLLMRGEKSHVLFGHGKEKLS